MRRIDNITEIEIGQYRQRSQKAINGIGILLNNTHLISSKRGVDEKYRTIAQYIGLIEDGSSYYNYFIPLENDIVLMLRLSNHNNTNEQLFNIHEQKGRPDVRYLIIFQGDSYTPASNSVFCEAKHYVYNYPVNALDNDSDIVAFLTTLKELLLKGQALFRGVKEEPRISNDDITAQWNRTIDKNTNESKTRKDMKQNKKTINEAQLRAIVKEAVKSLLNEKYNPWKRVEDENGVISYPRYEKDTQPYRDNLMKQATHLYKQIEFFLQTLAHAHPNSPDAKTYNDFHRSVGGNYSQNVQKVEDALEMAKSKLSLLFSNNGWYSDEY